MKKFIVLFFVAFIILLSGCANRPIINEEQPTITVPPQTVPPTENPPITVIPPLDQPEEETPPEYEEEEEEKKKKSYAVATTNSLRVRKGASSSSSTIGYLDKGDAVVIIGEENGYYKTVYKEKTAYVHSNYCSVMQIEPLSREIENAIDIGCGLLGYPYVWGSQRYHWGNGILNKNFVQGEYDCSALVQYVYYKSNSVILDVTSRAQSLNGQTVQKQDIKRGDLLFFTNASRKNKTGIERIGHVGIYFGNNYILHTASDHAVIEPISSTRWSYYVTAKRVV